MGRDSSTKKVLNRIRGHGRGWVFTPSDFADLGSPDAISQSLSRLERDQLIRRVARGVYDYPQRHPQLGLLSPNPDQVARAIAASTGSRLQASGSRAVNLLGLSTQVPAQLVY